jgi:hypothetical protein
MLCFQGYTANRKNHFPSLLFFIYFSFSCRFFTGPRLAGFRLPVAPLAVYKEGRPHIAFLPLKLFSAPNRELFH